jgi:vacuolar-type H+-ATPase subunit E/Vma4
VSSKDLAAARKLVEKDKELAGRITEVKEHGNLGGVIIEDMGGRVRIDNTYETRLEMLLPRLLPEVGKELFGG